LLGVNAYDDADTFRSMCEEHGVTWDNIFDGPTAPVCASWNVSGFPTTYIIDAEGKIRYKDARGESVAAKVEKLLAEIKEQ